MGTAMSNLFDEYPMLIFALEALLAVTLFVVIVVWTMSGRKRHARNDGRQRQTDDRNAT
jgi:hypothetical protein